MTFQLHPRRKGQKGIRSDAERERAATEVKFLRAAIQKVEAGKSSRRSTEFAAKCQEMLGERDGEIRDYDALKRGELTLPKLSRLDEVAAFVPRIRIARGVSQTELARRLGVSKQVVSRYEDAGYQTAGLGRLQQILDALHAEVKIELRNS